MIMNSHGLKEGLRHLPDEAFTRGFESTGEGWNGEYPGDHLDDADFIESKKEAVSKMLSELFPEG